MRSGCSPRSGFARPATRSKARSAASGLEKTYVELRNTAGRAEPTDKRGSNPRVSTFVEDRKPGFSSAITLQCNSGLTCYYEQQRTPLRKWARLSTLVHQA